MLQTTQKLEVFTQTKGGEKSTVGVRGCLKCAGCRVSCQIVKEGDSFTSTNTSRTYPIKQRLDCKSSFIIYLATCKKCQGQYVGKITTEFKKKDTAITRRK